MIQDFVYKEVAKYEAIFKVNNDVNTLYLRVLLELVDDKLRNN